MSDERRKHRRHRIHSAAKFIVESGGITRDCIITDVSERGARIVANDDIPDEFTLLISSNSIVKHECSVVWRLGVEVGVLFVTGEREQERLIAMRNFATKAREMFAKAK